MLVLLAPFLAFVQHTQHPLSIVAARTNTVPAIHARRTLDVRADLPNLDGTGAFKDIQE